MKPYDPATRFARADLEAELLAALTADPSRYAEVAEHLTPAMLSTEEAEARLTGRHRPRHRCRARRTGIREIVKFRAVCVLARDLGDGYVASAPLSGSKEGSPEA